MVREAVGRLSGDARAVVIHNNGATGAANHTYSSDQQDRVVVLSCSFSNPQLSDPGQYTTMSNAYQRCFRGGRQAFGPSMRRDCLRPPGRDAAMDLPAGAAVARNRVRPGHTVLYPPEDRGPAQQEHPRSAASGSIRSARSESDGSRFRTFRKASGPDSEAGIMARVGEPIRAIASITAAAIAARLQVCEANVGVRLQPASDCTESEHGLAQILGPMFLDMERNAAGWQRMRGSQGVPRFGEPVPPPAETGSTDVRRMIESFQLGVQDLQDVWSVVLPPRTMLEIGQPVASAGRPVPNTRRIVGSNRLRFRARTSLAIHQPRSSASLYHTTLPGLGRFIRTGDGNRGAGCHRVAARAVVAGL